MKIEGKVAIVTGGGQGIGERFCIALLEKGANVVIADIKTRQGESLSKQFNQKYGLNRTKFVQCDVTSDADFQNLINYTKSTFGNVDILCNNAGVPEMEQWEKVLNINLNSVIRGTKLAMEAMSTKNGGRGGIIINTASMGGILPMPSGPVYCASKFGVVGFSRSLDTCYESDGIRVNAICPSYAPTSLFEASIDSLVNANQHEEARKMKAIIISIDQVARGMIQLVEDDTKNGAVMRITAAKGIDYQPYRSSKL
ncbi:15-hydroxyprostaglandin dehydrogenase [NAD(+)] [Trichoplax sp. H2]|nr:15-hydroxyprostaglandin dehydrogenase [NAD(+)] [Trichoplax sp. H2]|eukprot:RDD43040.1 15-hydroxyprostaglandin dehydrogenase [NAD(+)] [Trichoplax sp. H2]